jgi:hypothetical protein
MVDTDQRGIFTLAHEIDGCKMFDAKYPSLKKGYVSFLSQAKELFDLTGELQTQDIEDLMILLFFSARAHREGFMGFSDQVFHTPFVEALVQAMKRLLHEAEKPA